MAGHENERKTRNKRIDPRLDAAGWPLPGEPPRRTEDEEIANGPADYAPWLDDGIVGLVEAKNRIFTLATLADTQFNRTTFTTGSRGGSKS